MTALLGRLKQLNVAEAVAGLALILLKYVTPLLDWVSRWEALKSVADFVPTAWSFFVGPIGTGITLLLGLGLIVHAVFRPRQDISHRVRDERTSVAQIDPGFSFNPWMIHQKLLGVNLMGLWGSDYWIDFEIELRNVSGLSVIVSGVKGHVFCGDEECNAEPSLRTPPAQMESSSATPLIVIRQPIAKDMADGIKERLRTVGGKVIFTLSSLTLTGSVDSPTQSLPLQWPISVEQYTGRTPYGGFVLKGPVFNAQDAGMMRARATFISPGLYTEDGEMKAPHMGL